jgi:hypothetical protein
LADYCIILDDLSRYAALVTTRYLPPISNECINTARKAMYASPLPASPVFTKNDCSQNYAAAMKLQEEYGFDCAVAIGSLIWLMNTFVKLSLVIRMLATYMQYPGKQHFIYLRHLLNHTQCHRCSRGIKFYSNTKLSPLHQLMIDSGNSEHAEAPIIQFTDSSFQDCPDTSRSTGGHLSFVQGAVTLLAQCLQSSANLNAKRSTVWLVLRSWPESSVLISSNRRCSVLGLLS